MLYSIYASLRRRRSQMSYSSADLRVPMAVRARARFCSSVTSRSRRSSNCATCQPNCVRNGSEISWFQLVETRLEFRDEHAWRLEAEITAAVFRSGVVGEFLGQQIGREHV